MLTLHFEGRDVPPYAEYAPADTLVEGKTYFRLGYLDKDLTIPKMNPMIFIGRDLGQGDASQLYFQDAESYLDGTRFGTATRNGDAEFHVVDETTPFVFEFERALDRLLYLSASRSKT